MRQKHKLPKELNKATLFFDGACSPRNPGGYATFGWWIQKDNEVYAFDHSLHSLPGPNSTNNVAEYASLIAGLKGVIEAGLHTERFTVKGDSALVINQITRYWAVHSPLLLPLYQEATALVSQCHYVSFQWIPREQNTDADFLSKQAYEAAVSLHGNFSPPPLPSDSNTIYPNFSRLPLSAQLQLLRPFQPA